MKRLVWRAALAATCGYVAITGILWAAQERFVFPGWDGPSAAMVVQVPGLSEISVPTEVGPLRAWYREAGPDQPTLLLFHGNAGFHWGKLAAFAGAGWGLLLTSYRGYAGNPGHPSEAGLIQDGHAVLDHAADVLEVPISQTVLYGESLGSGVAAQLAAVRPGYRAVVLVSAYTSVEDRAAETYPFLPVRPLIRTKFATREVLGQIKMPLLILHGTEDRVIPFHHGKALAALRPDASTLWLAGGNHYLPPDWTAQAVDDFLARPD